MHFPNILQLNSGIDQKILADLKVYLRYYFKIAFLKKIIVGQYAACYGIFNGHYSTSAFLFVRCYSYYISESIARNNLYRFTKEVLGRHLVEAAFVALYGDSIGHKKKSPGFAGRPLC